MCTCMVNAQGCVCATMRVLCGSLAWSLFWYVSARMPFPPGPFNRPSAWLPVLSTDWSDKAMAVTTCYLTNPKGCRLYCEFLLFSSALQSFALPPSSARAALHFFFSSYQSFCFFLPFRIIDFTKPYLSTGVTFLYKPPAVPASSWDRQLLGVFAIELWLLVGASFIITAIALMFLQVPFG